MELLLLLRIACDAYLVLEGGRWFTTVHPLVGLLRDESAVLEHSNFSTGPTASTRYA
jgi:hypothetical protein